MTVQERLHEIIDDLSEERQRALLEYAEFLDSREEREAWTALGLKHLAKAYGDDEPEYTLADIID